VTRLIFESDVATLADMGFDRTAAAQVRGWVGGAVSQVV
jgi:hypothetical protein